MIKIKHTFWDRHVQNTEYDFHMFKMNDIECFLQDTLHKSAKILPGEDYCFKLSFDKPKYETLFCIKYSDDII